MYLRRRICASLTIFFMSAVFFEAFACMLVISWKVCITTRIPRRRYSAQTKAIAESINYRLVLEVKCWRPFTRLSISPTWDARGVDGLEHLAFWYSLYCCICIGQQGFWYIRNAVVAVMFGAISLICTVVFLSDSTTGSDIKMKMDFAWTMAF